MSDLSGQVATLANVTRSVSFSTKNFLRDAKLLDEQNTAVLYAVMLGSTGSLLGYLSHLIYSPISALIVGPLLAMIGFCTGLLIGRGKRRRLADRELSSRRAMLEFVRRERKKVPRDASDELRQAYDRIEQGVIASLVPARGDGIRGDSEERESRQIIEEQGSNIGIMTDIRFSGRAMSENSTDTVADFDARGRKAL